ncbi:MAG: DUF1080 domain-containing protein [Planctomycetes bacterium]|nr:DUF1080 domain-containing protein [Planctomycetota bacterium]
MIRAHILVFLTFIPLFAFAPRETGNAPASAPASGAPVSSAADARAEGMRALVLVGGEHHAVEANTASVVDILKNGGVKLSKVDFVRIDAPPPGKPSAEKATLASNPDVLKDPELNNKYDIIFQYTQDSYIEKLDSDHVDGLLNFVRSGGSWIGWHCASDTFKTYPEYIKMVGGRFETHPAYGPVKIQRVATTSPVGEGVEDFETPDELYFLADAPAADKELILVANSPGGKTRPVAWTKRYGAGKVFYTTLGHGPEVYKNPMFQKLIVNAATWASYKGNGAVENGAIVLFNNHDLEGWTMCGPGRFVVDKGSVVTAGGMGMLWYDRRSFRDFTIDLEWSVGRKEDNSGVFVRFPAPMNPWTAVYQGYEIQIGDTFDAKHNTGSVYDFKEPTSVPTKPVGEWNKYRISVKGQKYTIYVNDEKVNEYEGSRSLEGHIGLQNHDNDSHVRFRNIKITESR